MSSTGAMLRTLRRLVRLHGPLQTARWLGAKWIRKLRHIRPRNTTEGNREVWSTHDWSRLGEEWTLSPEWKAAIVEELLIPWIPEGASILEIGPGGGRWTEYLVPRASRLVLVDVTPVCIDICRERFGAHPQIEFHVNNGTDLSFIAPGSIDAIWSYDVFVHIDSPDVEQYIRQFAQLLAPNGAAVLHHARRGRNPRSWRSDMTDEMMGIFAHRYGFVVEVQTTTVRNGAVNVYPKGGDEYPDVVTVIRRPASS